MFETPDVLQKRSISCVLEWKGAPLARRPVTKLARTHVRPMAGKLVSARVTITLFTWRILFWLCFDRGFVLVDILQIVAFGGPACEVL